MFFKASRSISFLLSINLEGILFLIANSESLFELELFTDPITIEFIDIELYDENGKLFDFSDLDHSFTISLEKKNLITISTY